MRVAPSRSVGVTSSLVALGGLGVNRQPKAVERTTDSVLLTADELLFPAGGTYVPWRVDEIRSPLVQHLVHSVPGFEQASSEMVGFVGQHVRSATQYVEAALIEAGDASAAAIVDATTAWLTATHGEHAVQVDRFEEAIQWTTSADGITDTLRLEAIRPGTLLFVVTRGPEHALLLPQEAVERYAATIRKRADSTESQWARTFDGVRGGASFVLRSRRAERTDSGGERR
jgi:hypothetical protein